jgi:hypothetical protein
VVPAPGVNRVRVQQEDLRRHASEECVPAPLVVPDGKAQRGQVVLRHRGETGLVALARGAHPGLLERPVLVVDGDRQVALARARQPRAGRADLGLGVALAEEGEAEEAQRAAAGAKVGVDRDPGALHVRDPGVGVGGAEAQVPVRVVAELVAGREPQVEERPIARVLHVAPGHEADGRDAVLREGGEEALGDAAPLGGVGVEAGGDRQVVDGHEQRACWRGGEEQAGEGEREHGSSSSTYYDGHPRPE